MARQLYSGVPGSNSITNTEWSIPCNSTFPITLAFGDKSFVMNERDSIVKLANGTCRGVVTGGAQNNVAQVGAPFLRNVYTYVFCFVFSRFYNMVILMTHRVQCLSFFNLGNLVRKRLAMDRLPFLLDSRQRTCARTQLLPVLRPHQRAPPSDFDQWLLCFLNGGYEFRFFFNTRGCLDCCNDLPI